METRTLFRISHLITGRIWNKIWPRDLGGKKILAQYVNNKLVVYLVEDQIQFQT